jgi:uncharacterized membrane protein
LGRIESRVFSPGDCCPGLFFLVSIPEKRIVFIEKVEERFKMVRKFFIIFLMAPLLIGAVVTGTSFPVLFLMFSLLLIALLESSARDEQEE